MTVRTMLVSGDITFDKFMETIIRRGELSCGHDRICVKYMTNAGAFSRDRAPPVEIMNDEDVQIYLNDRNGEGGRPILRVSSIEKSLKSGCGLSNHQSEDVLSSQVEKEVPRDNEDVLPCQVENDISLDNEDILPFQVERDTPLDNEVDVQLPELLNDATIRSHHSYIFSDGSAKAYRIEEFNEYLEEIRRKGYGNVVEYLENVIGFKRWSRAHFTGQRYDVMTTNIAESVNARLVIERELPIIALFNAIQRLLCRWFRERRGLTLSTNNYLAPAENILVRETRYEIADKLSVHQLHVNEFIVKGDGQDARVNINVKTCTCRL
ncbi:hypothetical protein BC332_24609 [Capsicum chinense]|nr:hypothetical protein BC332_24609 [Capsicum chinense]